MIAVESTWEWKQSFHPCRAMLGRLPVTAASVMTRRTSLSMTGLLHTSSQDPRTPFCTANTVSCFWLGTTKLMTYDSSLGTGKENGRDWTIGMCD